MAYEDEYSQDEFNEFELEPVVPTAPITPAPDPARFEDIEADTDQADDFVIPTTGIPSSANEPDTFGNLSTPGRLDEIYYGNLMDGPVTDSTQLYGHFDAYAAQVVKVWYGGTHPVLNCEQAIDVVRCDVRWGTNNDPTAAKIAQAFSEPTPTTVAALPFPPSHDQAGYHVEAGDIVTILAGRDGRFWYLRDEQPFVAQVIMAEASATEAFAGGAGLLNIKVRRQALSGDPSADVASLAPLQDAAAATVDYDNVLVIKSTNQQHGYRCGDYCWITRRGAYYFALPSRECFPARITATGPSAEVDFSTNNYWVREYDGTVTYSGDNAWSLSQADRTQTDPSGSGGRYGLWVQATNVAEDSAEHTLAASTTVIVHVFADPATQEPYYQFASSPPYTGDGVWIGDQDGVNKNADFADRVIEHLVWDEANKSENVAWYGFSSVEGSTPSPSSYEGYFSVTQFKEWLDSRNHGEIESTGSTGYIHVNIPTTALLNATAHTDTITGAPLKGDLILGTDQGGAVIAWEQLTIGTAGQVLTVSGGTAAWSSAVDEKVKVSYDDTTADYLENKLEDTADDATYVGVDFETQNAGGNETIKAKILKSDIQDAAGTLAGRLEIAFSVNVPAGIGASQLEIDTANDWRGRVIHNAYTGLAGTTTNADQNGWSNLTTSACGTGKDSAGDYNLSGYTTIEGGSGHLWVKYPNFGTQQQFFYYLIASPQLSAGDYTMS